MTLLQNVSHDSVTRRGFLGAVAAAGGLVLGTRLGAASWWSEPQAAEFTPNLFLSIDGDGIVSIVAHRSEMGTGIRTVLPLVVADELDAELDRVKIEQAIGDKRLGSQNTDGSKSIREFYQPMREAGAAARAMLERAAAEQWGVPAEECHAAAHAIHHAKSGRSAGFGELVEAAAKLPVPSVRELQFKSKEQWRYVGKKHSIVDAHDITTGKAKFGLDVTPEGTLVAMIARSPVLGGAVASVDDSAAKSVAGVVEVIELPAATAPFVFKPLGGVAVLAKDTWAAKKGRDALKIDWSASENDSYDSAGYREGLERAVRERGFAVRRRGDANDALDKAEKKHVAEYYLPHLAHASMEPPCAVAHVTGNRCEVWAPVQNPQAAQATVAQALGIKPQDVICHVTLLGGGFGRKSKPDYCAEAAWLSKQVGKPVKVVWTREDDIRHDFFHSVSALRMEAALGEDGKPTAWLARTAFPSIASTFHKGVKRGSPMELGLGFIDVPYDIPNIRIEVGEAEGHVRIGWLRSVSNIYHAFAVSSFTDELALAAGRDAVSYTLDLIGEPREIEFDNAVYTNYGEPTERHPIDVGRYRRVVELCAEKAGWGKELPKGRGQGFAVHRSFVAYVAAIVEVEVSKDGRLSFPRVDIAVDCGLAVSPDRVRSQMEGAVIFGQSLALYGEITAKDGAIVQSNFHDYPVARITDAPREIHVHVVESESLPTGVGEPGVPPIAPAICAA
ncbi:MAG: xanthine dehydrogenase family protein molybdopterin-binding subunit, partial [Planctomycetes bacterium]|nr:xanthine dehydrogenase family protein molybdopterin-binding subunit [Planctomycetota bacterium]